MILSLVLMVSVFGAGLLSFFSPCIFPVLPVYLGILLDADDSKTITIFGKKLYWYGIVKTLAFIFGLSTIFVILGYGAGFRKYPLCGMVSVLTGSLGHYLGDSSDGPHYH